MMVNSTSPYPELNANGSPFNVGTGIDEREGLSGFSIDEAQKLLRKHQIAVQPPDSLEELNQNLAGHPYLLDQFCEEAKEQQLSTGLLSLVTIFHHHLSEICNTLARNPDLWESYKRFLRTADLYLPPDQAFQLDSMGLVKIEEHLPVKTRVASRCDLYRIYFMGQFIVQDAVKEQNLPNTWRDRLTQNTLTNGARAALVHLVQHSLQNNPFLGAIIAFIDEAGQHQ
jgi:hypothetical protein